MSALITRWRVRRIERKRERLQRWIRQEIRELRISAATLPPDHHCLPMIQATLRDHDRWVAKQEARP